MNNEQSPKGIVIEEMHMIKRSPAADAVIDALIRGARDTGAPGGPFRIACPHCGSPVGSSCTTASGKHAATTHAARRDSYKRRIRSEWFVVRVRADDARLGVLAGERYEAQLYVLDPEKVTLLRRIPDGYDPQCNHYWGDVDFMGWGRDSR